MKKIMFKIWSRFVSQMPPLVKKSQIVLTLAGSSFTAGAAINWPGNLAAAGTFCGYAAAISAATVIGLQFTQQAATIFEEECVEK